jgi:hypothetical protein
MNGQYSRQCFWRLRTDSEKEMNDLQCKIKGQLGWIDESSAKNKILILERRIITGPVSLHSVL